MCCDCKANTYNYPYPSVKNNLILIIILFKQQYVELKLVKFEPFKFELFERVILFEHIQQFRVRQQFILFHIRLVSEHKLRDGMGDKLFEQFKLVNEFLVFIQFIEFEQFE